MQSNERLATDDVSIDLRSILAAVWRARRWIVPVVAVTAIASAVGLSLLPPKYKGEARVLIEPREIQIRADQRAPETEKALLDQEGVASQVQLLTSRDIARRVIARENLGSQPDFAPGLLSDLMRMAGIGRDPMKDSPEERYLETFFERLEVFQVEKSRVIQIEFSARNPDLAAKVANAVVREYLQTQADAKRQNSSDATRWLDAEIKTLRAKVTEAEAKVEAYRSGSELFVATNNNTLVQQQLAELNTQLTNARALKSDAEAKVAQVRKVIESGADFDGASEIVSQPIFQRLREREVALRSRIAELSAVYLPNHPQIQTLNSQLRDIDTQTRAEARRILSALETDVRVADQRIRELRAQLAEFKSQASKANQEDIQLRALEREAKAQRELLETFLARYREASSRQNSDAQPADARVISEASPPIKAYFPKVGPLTSVITLATFLLSVTGVVLSEILSGNALRFGAVAPMPARRPDETEAPAPAALVAAPVAEPPSAGERLSDRTDLLARAGAAAEQLNRGQGTAPSADAGPVLIPLARTDADALWGSVTTARLVAVVAASDAAVARSAALALARSGARLDAGVCLVCVSSETAHTLSLVGSAEVVGFTDLAAGAAGFGDVIHRDRGSDLHVIPPGGRELDAADPDRCRTLLEALAQSYAHVVVDVGGLTEAPVWALELAAGADAVVVATAQRDVDAATVSVVDALTRTEPGHVHVFCPPAAVATLAA